MNDFIHSPPSRSSRCQSVAADRLEAHTGAAPSRTVNTVNTVSVLLFSYVLYTVVVVIVVQLAVLKPRSSCTVWIAYGNTHVDSIITNILCRLAIFPIVFEGRVILSTSENETY